MRGVRAPTSSCGGATRTASGRSTCTARRNVALGQLTVSSATCSRCASGSRTQSERRWSGNRRGTGTRGRRRGRDRQLGASRRCSGVPELPGSSSRRPSTSTRSCCSPARSWSGRPAPHGDEKGYGICHGTAGNGYALLKAFERTGDERGSSAPAASQSMPSSRPKAGKPRGRGRYSLWTGDVGAPSIRGGLPGREGALSDPRRTWDCRRDWSSGRWWLVISGSSTSGSSDRTAPLVPRARRYDTARRRALSPRRSRAPIRPTTTSCCSTTPPWDGCRRMSSWTIRPTQSSSASATRQRPVSTSSSARRS